LYQLGIEPNQDVSEQTMEEKIVMKAMVDLNSMKLSDSDLSIFHNIILDVFKADTAGALQRSITIRARSTDIEIGDKEL